MWSYCSVHYKNIIIIASKFKINLEEISLSSEQVKKPFTSGEIRFLHVHCQLKISFSLSQAISHPPDGVKYVYTSIVCNVLYQTLLYTQ